MSCFPRVKICCIQNQAEAELAVRAGASALGLVGQMPGGPGVISDGEIHAIVRKTPPPISTFLLTSETVATDVVRHQQKVHTDTIQLVDILIDAAYEQVRQQIPHVRIVQVLHVTGEQAVNHARNLAPLVDALLLDSGNPNAVIRELGGTGRTHNWSISRKIVEAVDVPVFLAGGLYPGNIRKAVEMVKPFGIDVCSGVRTRGKLDPIKLEKFFCALEGIRY